MTVPGCAAVFPSGASARFWTFVKPITIPAELLASITAGFVKFGAQRCDDPLLHHVLVERAEGRVILAVTNLASALVYLHLPAPLPLTEMQRKAMSMKWAR